MLRENQTSCYQPWTKGAITSIPDAQLILSYEGVNCGRRGTDASRIQTSLQKRSHILFRLF